MRRNGHRPGALLVSCAFDSRFGGLFVSRAALSCIVALALRSVFCVYLPQTCQREANPIMATPLPPFWSEEKDPRGRTYYSNHQTRETTWEVSAFRERKQLGAEQEASLVFGSESREQRLKVLRITTLPENFRRILFPSRP